MHLPPFVAAALVSASLAAHADTFLYKMDLNPILGIDQEVTFTEPSIITTNTTVSVGVVGAASVVVDPTLNSCSAVARYSCLQIEYENGVTSYMDFLTNIETPGNYTDIFGDTFSLIDLPTPFPAAFAIRDISTAASVTPEPSSIALLGTGMLGVAGVIRKRLAKA